MDSPTWKARWSAGMAALTVRPARVRMCRPAPGSGQGTSSSPFRYTAAVSPATTGLSFERPEALDRQSPSHSVWLHLFRLSVECVWQSPRRPEPDHCQDSRAALLATDHDSSRILLSRRVIWSWEHGVGRGALLEDAMPLPGSWGGTSATT